MLRARVRRLRVARRADDQDALLEAARDVADLADLLALLVGGGS